MRQIYKYPRTRHLRGSRFQPGDEDLNDVPFEDIQNKYVVVEEKIDGANAAISFNSDGKLLLQSRGHYLTGGTREKHFNLFKQWANIRSFDLWEVLSDRYILYGEWMFAKHTVFYNALPHYFLEYDVLDLERQVFLSTKERKQLLGGLGIVSVPVLFTGELESSQHLLSFLGKSNYQTDNHLQHFRDICLEKELDIERSLQQTDQSCLMEGLYIKVESDDVVEGRYKYVRSSFLTTIQNSEGHWLNRPIIPNGLHSDVDLFSC